MTDKINIESDVSNIKGIGTKKRDQLAEAGIETIAELLDYYPVKYKDRRNIISAIDAGTDKESLVCGKLMKIGFKPLAGKRSILECTMSDGTCYFYAVFFNMPYLRKSLKIGQKYVIFGKMRIRNGAKVWTNPEMTSEGSDRDVRGIIPVYRHQAGLSDINLRKWINEALLVSDYANDWIQEDVIEKRNLCDREFAYKNIHFPQSEKHYKAAKYRLNYERMLMYQLTVRIGRQRNAEANLDASVPEQNIDTFLDSLPFKLTQGQLSCIKDINSDLSDARPMNRLVQGDVGCGKTVVAEAAMYRCAMSRLQSAMMAPTEILAKQHFENINDDLSPFGIKCALLVSDMKTKDKREIVDAVSKGSIDILIGTHALIQKDVTFSNLALVITDEQHRFGVDQRKALINKGRAVNVCVMSATPIPRTLATTVFGDMDFSVIRSMPGDRKKIITRSLDNDGREKAYIGLKEELDKGNLGYVIAPSIDSEDDDLQSVNMLYEEIKNKFRDNKVALLHGRLSSDEKKSIMEDFASSKIQVLVSTIVIEVGIDVPKATVIIIENAERFGLSQMHQLRGRVGRSDLQSYCYVINYSRSETALARAEAMAEIDDGFEISELDYELRGAGDIMGTVQSGNINRDILTLSRNTELLEAAIEDANYIIENDGDTDMEYAYEKIMKTSAQDNSHII